MRRIEYLPEEATLSHLLEKSKELFFPEGKSQKGLLSKMNAELGNFQHETIKTFENHEGKQVTFPEYLKSYGLVSGRANLFLMTTGNEKRENPSTQENEDGKSENDDVLMQDDILGPCSGSSSTSCWEDQFPSSGRNLESMRSVSLTSSFASSSNIPSTDNRVFVPASVVVHDSWECTDEWIKNNDISIQYELTSHSLYSDQEVTISSFCRERCYEVACVNNPVLLDVPLQEFQPPESNFVVTNIAKCDNQYLAQMLKSSSSSLGENLTGPENFYEFPMANKDETSVILHHPSNLWGFDDKQLIIAVVTSHPNSSIYTWYRNNVQYKEGTFNYCCLAVTEEGEYSVKVQCDGKEEVSKLVQIVNYSICSNLPLVDSRSQDRGDIQLSESASYGIPIIERKDLHYDPKIDEIGRDTFGAVYKATWAGTSVAVKQMKNTAPKIRHPNIVQIMAVAIGKSAIYIVSELVIGANLEELLFSDEDDGCAFTIPCEKKEFIGRQIVQAVAYLHNRKPPILHRDIKPANVLVTNESYVTKLCDMGLGKIKSAQTTSYVTGTSIAGTPNYMSPECLVEKATATTKADVWSLTCTLLELFTGKDCWEQVEDFVTQSEQKEDSSSAICLCLKAKELPRAMQYILPTNDNLKQILLNCFNYDASKRPDAIDILKYF